MTSRSIEGYTFEHVGKIEPLRSPDGYVIEEMPQSRYLNSDGLPLNNYGQGPYCRFRIGKGRRESGIYIITSGNTALYVGECQNLEDRYNSSGYGGISPRNCFKGGQETNCRINSLVLNAAKDGVGLALWFYPLAGDKAKRIAIEMRLITALGPPWNR